ncbi:hypothetical protein P280DRAFT_471112 [Massarina eburnea CBS 473.64]|uniref:Uncharacterized protein n=1 Tax=Massarina eburnea CBS 473.64 TaxID=1395130 RepID=A0A6A6RU40_9PLEO|nr:hypothetical protein P280DRAFT_471112 [Massarina eburnea CBS 473.64]
MFLDVPQGRALAIILPSVTLLAHVSSFFILRAFFATSRSTSSCAWYDLVCAIASAMGIFGAIKRRFHLVSVYAMVHAATLTVITFVLLVNILPASLPRSVPVLDYVRYDTNFEHWMCHELDDGFGWDAHWFEQCKLSFHTLSTGAAWASSVLMVAQWWALFGVVRWNIDMKSRKVSWEDLEKARR